MIKKLMMLATIIAILPFAIFAQSKIDIEGGLTYDWGKVKAGGDGQLKAKVKIFNKGKDTLKISEVKPGCGCTTAPLDKKEVEPGGFSTLDITLNIGSNEGDIAKQITINSNDPDNKQIVLGLRANIWRPITLFPKYMGFNKLFVGEEAISKVTITNNVPSPIKITKVQIDPVDVTINLKVGDVIKGNETIALEAHYLPKLAGKLNVRIILNTDNPETPTIDVSGWGNIAEKTPEAPQGATITPNQK